MNLKRIKLSLCRSLNGLFFITSSFKSTDPKNAFISAFNSNPQKTSDIRHQEQNFKTKALKIVFTLLPNRDGWGPLCSRPKN